MQSIKFHVAKGIRDYPDSYDPNGLTPTQYNRALILEIILRVLQ